MNRTLLQSSGCAVALTIVVAGCSQLDSAELVAAPVMLAGVYLDDDVAVSPPGEDYVAATFSPDGRWLALALAGLGAVDVVAADGRGPVRRVAVGERAGYRFAWTADGSALLHRVGATTLLRSSLAGRSEVLAVAARVGFPAVRANGELLFSADGELRGARGLDRQPVKHQGLVTVVAAAAPLLAGWDGFQIFVVDLARGERRELFAGRGFFDVELTADGQLALVRESRGIDGHLWIAATDGSTRRDLGVGWLGRLAPDGRSVIYVLQTNDGTRFTSADLWLMTIDGSQRVQLTASDDQLEIEPVFAPDGERLAYVDAATGRVHVAHLRREVRP